VSVAVRCGGLLRGLLGAGAPYAEARCLVACDEQGIGVGGVTVWSAGPGRPGLLEPMGVHRDHRGRGYGTAATTAAPRPPGVIVNSTTTPRSCDAYAIAPAERRRLSSPASASVPPIASSGTAGSR
jgi:GNAT superfamily N-acetyltransferase